MSAALDQTMGALLMGTVTAGILYGVSCSQVFYYYTRYLTDPVGVKTLVAAVWLSDTTHQALIIQSVYSYLITEYGNAAALRIPNVAIIIEVMFNAITQILVQSFFAHRIWKLSGRKIYLVAPVAALALAEFIASVLYVVRAFRVRDFEKIGGPGVKALSICMIAFAAAGDIFIAGILCTILHSSKTGFSRSNTLINKLMVFAINTGLLTSVCACASLITFWVYPNTFVYICFYFLMGRLYSNSLMATLNARKSLQAHSTGDLSISLRDVSGSASGTATNPYGLSTQRGRDGIAIKIETTREAQTGSEYDLVHNKHVAV
ncbi:hypothetical protein C8Q76DRAFT_798357 [Earliella scabrosa]|nr:hypothetical protein C8Q76DRAFT_798357 [Earliella scabrosa]